MGYKWNLPVTIWSCTCPSPRASRLWTQLNERAGKETDKKAGNEVKRNSHNFQNCFKTYIFLLGFAITNITWIRRLLYHVILRFNKMKLFVVTLAIKFIFWLRCDSLNIKYLPPTKHCQFYFGGAPW